MYNNSRGCVSLLEALPEDLHNCIWKCVYTDALMMLSEGIRAWRVVQKWKEMEDYVINDDTNTSVRWLQPPSYEIRHFMNHVLNNQPHKLLGWSFAGWESPMPPMYTICVREWRCWGTRLAWCYNVGSGVYILYHFDENGEWTATNVMCAHLMEVLCFVVDGHRQCFQVIESIRDQRI